MKKLIVLVFLFAFFVPLMGQCNSHNVPLSWVSSTSPEVVGYNVYRSVTSGGPYMKINFNPVARSTYLDQKVQGGTTYYYRVTAVSDEGEESRYSNETKATIPGEPSVPVVRGNLFVDSVSGARGAVVSIPITLTNDAQEKVVSLQYSITVPRLSFGKVKVISGPAAESKDIVCQWQEEKMGGKTDTLMCMQSDANENSTPIENGVVAHINISLPKTPTKPFYVFVSEAVGSLVSGCEISLVGQGGLITVEDTAVTPAAKPAAPPMRFAPNPKQIPAPMLESISCHQFDRVLVRCAVAYDIVPLGYLELEVFSSDSEYIKPITLLTGPNKKRNSFWVPVDKNPPSGTKIAIGVRMEGKTVFSESITWP